MSSPKALVRVQPAPYSPDRYHGYRVLWVKVIIRAAYDYALWKDSKDLKLRKFAEDAERWLFEDGDLPNSFTTVCNMYGLPLQKLQSWARHLTRDDVKKLEFRERDGRDTFDALTELAQKPKSLEGCTNSSAMTFEVYADGDDQ